MPVLTIRDCIQVYHEDWQALSFEKYLPITSSQEP